MTTRVKVFTDIPDEGTLKAMMEDYKDSGAEVGWARQSDGRFRLEVVFKEQSPLPTLGSFPSFVTGNALNRG
jgi:hypothetical protein